MDLKLRKRIRKFLEQNSTLDINNTAETEALLKQDKKLTDALEAEFFISNTGEKSIFSLFKTIASSIKEKIVVIGSKKGGFISYVLNKRKQKYPTAELDQQTIANDVKRKIDKSLEKGEAEELSGKGTSSGKTAYEHESGILKQEPNKKGDKFRFSVEGKFTGTLEVARMDKEGNLISGAVDIIDFVDGKVAYMLIATEGICRVKNIDELALQAEVVIGEVKKAVTREFSTQTDVEPITPQELTDARNQISALEQKLDSKDKEIAEVDRKHKEAIGSLEESKRKIIQLQETTSAYAEKQIAIEREKLRAAERKVNESDRLAFELRQELGALQKSYSEKVQNLEERIRRGEADLAAQNQQLATSSRELEDEKIKLAEAKREMDALKAEQDKDKKLLEETRQKLNGIKLSGQKRGQAQEAQIMAMQDDIATMTQTIKDRDAEIQSSSTRYAQEAEKLKSSNLALEESKLLAQAKIVEMEAALEVAKEASQAAQERFDEALRESKGKVNELQIQLETKLQQFADAQKENERKLLEAQDAAKKIEELKAQSSAASEKQLEEERDNLEKVQAKLAKGKEEFRSLTEEIGGLKESHGQELAKLQEQLKQQEARIASQEESLRAQMAASEESLAEKERELARERTEVERLKQQQDKEKQEMEKAQNQLKRASEAEKGALEKDLEGIRKDLAERQAEIKRIQEEFEAEKDRFAKEKEEFARQKENAQSELLKGQEELNESQDQLLKALEENMKLTERIEEMEETAIANNNLEEYFEAINEQQDVVAQKSKVGEGVVTPDDESAARQNELENIITSLRHELSISKSSEAAKQYLAERQEAELAKLKAELKTKDQESLRKVDEVKSVYEAGAREFAEGLKGMRQTEKDLDALRTGRTKAGDLAIPHKPPRGI